MATVSLERPVPKRAAKRIAAVAVIAASSLLFTACAGGNEESGSPSQTVKVGVVTSTSGPLATYGNSWLKGLEAGLDYATAGTKAVDGKAIELGTVFDDQANPANAATGATQLVGDGANIIVGAATSAVALQLAAFAGENDVLFIDGVGATDAITGVNRNTFRACRQSYQDLAAAGTILKDASTANVTLLAQDNAFGTSQVQAGTQVFESLGAKVNAVVVDPDTTELGPAASQIAAAAPDLVFTNWAGASTASMWQAMAQQRVLGQIPVVTPITDRGAWKVYGEDPSGIRFLSQYPMGSSDIALDAELLKRVPEADPYTANGFVTALMLVQAVGKGDPSDTTSMIKALEGYKFDSPSGPMEIRAGDHALLQDMFIMQMTGAPASRELSLVGTLPAADVAPQAASKW